MARRGRKRKLDKKRDASGKIIQKPGLDRGTDELRARKEAIAGRPDVAIEFPLEIMAARRLISPDELQAGMRYARVVWRLFGGTVRAIDPNAGGGRKSSTPGGDVEAIAKALLENERHGRTDPSVYPYAPAQAVADYDWARSVLATKSKISRTLLDKVAVRLEIPDWLAKAFREEESGGKIRLVYRADKRNGDRQLGALRNALAALATRWGYAERSAA